MGLRDPLALIRFGVVLVALANDERPRLPSGAAFVSAVDLPWLAATIGVVATIGGKTLLGLVAAVVAGFPALQLRGRNQSIVV
jgi:hypothetical protein